jgi:hypothetical protein
LGFHDPAGERECSARGAPHIGENNLGDESVNVATDERAPELRVTPFSCTVEPHISALTPGAGRTTVPQGAAPLVIFAAFKLVSCRSLPWAAPGTGRRPLSLFRNRVT